MSRHWSINGRFLTQQVTGVQRYGREILMALDRLASGGHPLARDLVLELVVPRSTEQLPRLDAVRARRLGPANGHLWEQAVLPFGIPLCVFKHVVCIHDLNTRLVPDNFSPHFRALYRLLIPALGCTAEHITTVSGFSRAQLLRYRVGSRNKTSVIGNGHEHALGWRPEHSPKTRAVAGPDTIVVFGSGSPNKNVGLLVGMAQELAHANLRLAVAGASDMRVFAAGGELRSFDNVVCLGRLTDNEIAALLADSLCLAFPSFVEGFGLPPLEAMSLGCPVVVSDRSCLPEICGDAALYASPTDPNAWLEQFRRLRHDTAMRATLVERGLRRAALYSWSASAEAYLKVMARLDGLTVPGTRAHEAGERTDSEVGITLQHPLGRTSESRCTPVT
jgi:glycosyltransferase involved in cell wall biosynthesis